MSVQRREPEVEQANGRVVGKTCPHCDELIAEGALYLSCPSCLSPQHAECWNDSGRSCASYFCSSESRRPVSELGPARIVITREDTERPAAARPLPRRPAAVEIETRVDPFATAALAFGLLSVPLLGCALGPVAVLIGAVSLGRIAASGELTGRGRALAGFLCGILATVLWIGGGGVFLAMRENRSFDSPFLTAREMPQPPSEDLLKNVSPAVRRALRANVFIEGSEGLSRWVGSGIVVGATAHQIRVLTNRHVVDGDQGGTSELTVQTIGGQRARATVLWRAKGGDIALIEAALPNASQLVDVALAASGKVLPAIGSRVFAIGNPHSLTWSYTEGAVSSLRQHEQANHVLTFIQTQAPINPGNSGGGLYDMNGYLVGMNSWKISDAVGEGLAFAISVPSLLAQRSDLLDIRQRDPGPEDPDLPVEEQRK